MHNCIKHHYHCTAYLHIFSRQISHIIIHQYCFSAPLITSIYIYAFDQNKEKKVIVNNQKKPSFHPNNLFMHLKRLEDTRFRHLWYFPWRFLNFECTIRILDIQNKSEIIQQNLFVHSEFHQTLYLSLSLCVFVIDIFFNFRFFEIPFLSHSCFVAPCPLLVYEGHYNEWSVLMSFIWSDLF